MVRKLKPIKDVVDGMNEAHNSYLEFDRKEKQEDAQYWKGYHDGMKWMFRDR